MEPKEWMSLLQKKCCTVIGLGVSNLPLVDFLLAHGARVTARDRKTRDELSQVAEDLEQKGVRLFLGENYLDAIDEEIVFRSPGLYPGHEALLRARQNGAILTSEMELFLDLTPATVLAVTGSDGKTTTTTLTGLMLADACKRRGKGRVFVGGNIGEPLLPRVAEMTADDFAVVELSSFQLQTMRHSPVRAAVTNVSPNHLDWHSGMDEYIEAKPNIFRHAGNGLLVTNAACEITKKMAESATARRALFSAKLASREAFESLMHPGDSAYYLADGFLMHWNGETETRLLARDEILLPGLHNVENYLTAIALTEGLVPHESIRAVATTFTGVEHRLQRVRVLDGVTYYNSSIDSSPTRTAAALSALDPARPIVICGGYDKKIPFAPLAEALAKHARAVILTGATAEKIGAAIEACSSAAELSVTFEPGFEDAVKRARTMATPGDVVLLSPACASFDAFRNFAERGRGFCEIVNSFL